MPCGEAGLGLQTLDVVARRQQQLRRGAMTDRVPIHEGGRELVDGGGDHSVEVGDLVVQFEVVPSERPERDPVGRDHVAVVRHVRPPVKFLARLLTTLTLLQLIATLATDRGGHLTAERHKARAGLARARPLSMRTLAIVFWSGTRRPVSHIQRDVARGLQLQPLARRHPVQVPVDDDLE
jgi:hypothetical protein